MANKNNKGFTLIEIVIAMAVLTLLLTPIIKQFAQTMEVSRRAKEQQYVNEEASYTLEEAQVTSEKDLVTMYQKMVVDNPDITFSTSTDAVNCTLVDSSGTQINLVDGEGNPLKDETGSIVNTVEYKVDNYVLENVKIGPKKNIYNREVSIDNLSTQVKGCKNGTTDKGLNIKYNMSADEIPAGYTLTNEGSAVLRDGNGNVISVVVEDTDYVGNPNDTNLGNMQNLDYETVAMINGTAANFDEQAEKALFSMAMDKLKEINYEEWENGMLHSQGDNILLQHGYAPTMNKLTKIYVDELTDASNNKYYIVKADVFYYCSYTLDGTLAEATLTYNVFSQTFKTEQCPNIYFEYQPFISEMRSTGVNSYDVIYADNDYILIDNYVEDVKLYLYKPHLDAINVSTGITEADYERKENYTYTTVSPSADDLISDIAYEQFLLDNAVKIHVANANSNVERMTIFTNLNTEDNGPNSQFFVDKAAYGSFSGIHSEKEAYKSADKANFDRTLIKPISEDTRYDDRLRNVTVTLLPIETDNYGNAVTDNSGNKVIRKDANTVILSGAKGEK